MSDFPSRGPSALVNELVAKLEAFVVEQEQDDLERGYTVSFDFPQKYANFLIGKRGENINKLREEFDVDIKVENGKVEVKGPKAKADATRMRIINMGKKLEDETAHVLKIPAQYHRELIGQRGNQVNRLQDRYSVRVQFPRATVNDDIAETGSDAGAGARPNRSQQAADEVLVKGPSKGADSARDEILSLLQWVIDHGHSATISVAQNQVASLIGQRGREMDELVLILVPKLMFLMPTTRRMHLAALPFVSRVPSNRLLRPRRSCSSALRSLMLPSPSLSMSTRSTTRL